MIARHISVSSRGLTVKMWRAGTLAVIHFVLNWTLMQKEYSDVKAGFHLMNYGHRHASNKVFSKRRQKFIRLTHYTIKRFSLRLKMTHAHANIGLSSIQTLSKSPSERTSVSPLISSELHVDYKWWDFPVNLSNLSGENMMKFASRSTRPLQLLMRGEVPDVSHSAGTNTCECSLSLTYSDRSPNTNAHCMARSKTGGLGQSRPCLLSTMFDWIKQGSVSLNVVASPNPLTSLLPRQESFSLLAVCKGRLH